MPKLILMDASGNARQISLKPQTNTLGRGPHNDVMIDSLRASRSHAVITVESGETSITDLHSLNGTLVNGELVGRRPLTNGDAIQIGSVELRFVTLEQPLSETEALRLLTAPTLMVELDRGEITQREIPRDLRA